MTGSFPEHYKFVRRRRRGARRSRAGGDGGGFGDGIGKDFESLEQLDVAGGLQLVRGKVAFGGGAQGGGFGGERDLDVRLDAAMPEGTFVRGKPFLNGQEEGGAVGELELAQDGAGAEGGLADESGAVGVVQGAGHDLGVAGGAAVNEDGQGDVRGDAAGLDRDRGDDAAGVLFPEDVARLEEQAGGGDGFVEDAAGIVAEVKNKPWRPCRLISSRALRRSGRLPFAEHGDAQMGQAGAGQALPGDVVELDGGADDFDFAAAGRRGD